MALAKTELESEHPYCKPENGLDQQDLIYMLMLCPVEL
jgi:hypothetical protein